MGKRIHDYRLLFRRVFLVSYDVVAILAASALALLLRFEFSYSQIDAKYIEMIWTYFPINILTTVVSESVVAQKVCKPPGLFLAGSLGK